MKVFNPKLLMALTERCSSQGSSLLNINQANSFAFSFVDHLIASR